MTLDGFVSIPEQATTGGAPIDAFQADAFRSNDVLFEQVLQALMSSPYMPAGIDGDVADPDPRQFVNAKTIAVNTQRNLTPGVPLIWTAREKITLSHKINAVGAGAQAGQTGDFGGGGGGGANAGQACLMPFSTDIILAASAAGAAGLNLDTADAWKLSRLFLYLPFLKGGAAGSDGGGAGGGVVCLCAPVIEFVGANGIIDAQGASAGANNQGGGGGGLVVLIARQIVNANVGTTILINGGTAAGGSGQPGGNGKYIPHIFK